MKHYFVSIEELTKELETYDCIDDKIKKISSEILNCSNALTDQKKYLSETCFSQIFFTDVDIKLTEVLESILGNHPFKSIFSNDIFSQISYKILSSYYEFLEKARALLEYYKSLRELETEYVCVPNRLSTDKKNNTAPNRIVWKAGVSKLLKIFSVLNKYGYTPSCTKEEILTHFIIEGYEKESILNGKLILFQWLKSDTSFSVFVDELAKWGYISNRTKYVSFSSHFVNRYGKSFQHLPQKKNYTENVIHKGSGVIIRNILETAGIHSILLLFYMLVDNLDFMTFI